MEECASPEVFDSVIAVSKHSRELDCHLGDTGAVSFGFSIAEIEGADPTFDCLVVTVGDVIEHLLDSVPFVGEPSESVESCGVADDGVEFSGVIRFLDNIIGAHFERLDTHFDIGDAGDHDDGEFLDMACSSDAVDDGPAIESGEGNINDEDVGWIFQDFGESSF